LVLPAGAIARTSKLTLQIRPGDDVSDESPAIDESPDSAVPPPPRWASATVDDVSQVDFEELVRQSVSADAAELVGDDVDRRAHVDDRKGVVVENVDDLHGD